MSTAQRHAEITARCACRCDEHAIAAAFHRRTHATQAQKRQFAAAAAASACA